MSRSFNCFTISISHGIENYISGIWGTGLSDAILMSLVSLTVNSLFLMEVHQNAFFLCNPRIATGLWPLCVQIFREPGSAKKEERVPLHLGLMVPVVQ